MEHNSLSNVVIYTIKRNFVIYNGYVSQKQRAHYATQSYQSENWPRHGYQSNIADENFLLTKKWFVTS